MGKKGKAVEEAKAVEAPKAELNESEKKLGIWLYCQDHGWYRPPQPPGSCFLEKTGANPRMRLNFGATELVLETKRPLTNEEKETRPHHGYTWEVVDRASYDKVKEAPDGVTFEK